MLSHIPDDADIVKLGHLGKLSASKNIDSRFESALSYGSHAYIVFKKYYSKYIEATKKDLVIDKSAMNSGKSYSTKHMLFMQAIGKYDDVIHDNSWFSSKLERQGYTKSF